MTLHRFLGAAAAAGLVLAAAGSAHAQQPPPQQVQPPPPYQPPPPPPGYQQQPVQGPQYVAPLSQQTQPTYVPQSVALSGPREIKDWQEGDPIPPGYRPVERTRKGLVIGGAVTFGVLYLISALVASANADANPDQANPAAALYVPAIGPFIQMASTDGSTPKLFLAIDGIAQSAGVAMFVVGLTSPKTVLVRNDLGDNRPRVHFAPMLSSTTQGAGLVGTF
jgi:hypothetical protein